MAAVAMVIGFIAFVAFGVVYWIGANTEWQAITIGVGLLALGFGVTAGVSPHAPGSLRRRAPRIPFD